MKIVSGKRFAKVLEEHGWQLDRVNGSHHVYKALGGFATVTVPIHGNKDLKTGTLRALLRQTGMTEEQL